ncbi:conjugal transfer protein TraG [Thiorhodococcus mannitoliphagus]|uniref:Conjugal transfer protein TraG n=1 Tax=Thiorhodococcus mannitoliphagus TaxID=329406 RepID=A0A6P1DW82_9GAMM|nr:conjugal transfer protein TraG N-terminal domain-containing protein [Thiorhodococcus mannitoliphagus]NEX19885.1 conjugal transfer protein TraG [Thiorhodococcus mannitoliphagus]
MWTIYSIGDPAFLEQVLNAVAMLFGADSFVRFVGIGFLLGTLIIAFQGLLQGAQSIRFQGLLVSFVLYSLLFVPKVSVTIEGAYSGSVRVVDNVPLGPAVVGSAVSNLGYGLTRLFEQAFATPSMTEHGFADALQVMATVRKTALSRLTTGEANSPTAGADVEQSWLNYVADCVLYAVDRKINGTTMDRVLQATTLEAAFQTPIVTGTTKLILGETPEELTCVDAYGRLSAYTTASFLPKFKQAVAAKLGVDSGAVDSRVRAALTTLAQDTVDAQQYMVMTAILPMLERGVIQHYNDIGQWNAALQTSQAIQQRNSQWATEPSLFVRIMRPMMTFFEGFIFAIGPFMAFAVALGPIGIAMVGRYLIFGLWIQLWLPILAITNLYLILAAQRAFEALSDQAGVTLPSFRALYESDLLLQDYLATGGMLVASTPAISLMLIYGSAITATHLAGRLQSGDHVNEKLTSPDVLQPQAAGTVGPLLQRTALGGTVAPGAAGLLWSFNLGHSAQATLRSAEQSAEQAQESFSTSLSQALASSAAANHQTSLQYALGQRLDASYSRADAAVLAASEDLTERFRDSQLSHNQMGTVLRAAMAAPKTAKGIDRFAGELSTQYGVDSGMAHEIAQAALQKASTDQQLQARFAEGLAYDIQRGQSDSYTEGLNRTESAQLAHQAQDVLTTSRSVERAAQFAQQYGTSGRFGAVETSGLLLAHPALYERLEQILDRFGLAGDAAHQADALMAGGVVGDRQQARTIAGMGLLLGFYGGARAGAMTTDEQRQAEAAAQGIYAQLVGVRRPGPIAPEESGGLATHVPAFGGARGRVVAAGMQDPGTMVAAELMAQRVAADGMIETLGQAPASVEQFSSGGTAAVAQQHRANTSVIRADTHQRLGEEIADRASLPRPAAEIVQREMGGVWIRAAETGALAVAGAEGVSHQITESVGAFGQTLSSGGSLAEAMDAGRAAAGSVAGWSAARAAMIDMRLAQIEGYGLTSAQVALYREASESTLFAFAPSADQAAARQAVIEESGASGEAVATLIERAVVGRDDTDLRLIGQYNQSVPTGPVLEPPAIGTLGPPTVRGPLMHASVTEGRLGHVLDLIAVPESHGNYNAWYDNADQNDVDLSTLTLGEVRTLQQQLLDAGNGGSAIGRYQFVPSTLEDLTDRLGLSESEPFTPALQDRLALVLARDAGVNDWMAGTLPSDAFAYNLSKTWAGLPKDASNQSYHQGVGDNAARIDYTTVLERLRAIRGGDSAPTVASAPTSAP